MVLIELDVRSLNVDVDPSLYVIWNRDIHVVLAMHSLPAWGDMCMERPLPQRVVLTLDREIELAHRLQLELGSVRQCLTRMLESRISIEECGRPGFALMFEGGTLTAVTLFDSAITREKRLETVLGIKEMSSELVRRGLDQLHRAPPLCTSIWR